tara:strand:- start:2735 stop:3646 length:912 start_codon:yes stop_codon:yes gene_type:complete
MGNPKFAIPTLNAIQKSDHDLIAIVSNPPKPIGRGRIFHSTAVGQFAKDNLIHLIEPKNLNSENLSEELKKLNPDIFVVVAYKILPEKLLLLPRHGSINLHASLLPKYRGAGPIQWALMNGDKNTGVTIFQIKKKIDAGDILLQKEIKIGDDDNMLSLGMRICEEGAKMVLTVLKKIEDDTIKIIVQDSNKITFAPKITKEMSIINWNWQNVKIHNWIRGLSPFPGMSTFFKKRRLRIYKTSLLDGQIKNPGQVIQSSKERLIISTGKGLLEIFEIQLEGKKKLPVREFLMGIDIKSGDMFGR